MALKNPLIVSAGRVQEITSSDTVNVTVLGTTQAPQFARIGIGAAADANNLVQLSLGTITTDKHLIDGLATWNASGVTFFGIKINITNTASAAASRIVDLQVASVSKFSIDITGKVLLGAAVNLKNYTVASLPTGVRGDVVYVTDATTPTFHSIVAGGGAIVSPVFYNGTNWINI